MLYRNKLGLTQKELADKSGITRVSIGNYERGDRIPPADILNKIAISLEITINTLINEQDKDINSTIGNNIKLYRLNLGMSQKQLAQTIGVCTETVQNYENNRREPNMETLNKIADIFCIPLNYLINSNDKTNCIIKEKDIALFSTDELLTEIKRRIESNI